MTYFSISFSFSIAKTIVNCKNVYGGTMIDSNGNGYGELVCSSGVVAKENFGLQP